MNQDFNEIQQRVRHYWFKDGVGEIAVGGLFLMLSLYFAGHYFAGTRFLPSVWNAPLYIDLGLAFLLLIGIVLTRKIIAVVKMHITYPRTGYVEYYIESKSSLLVRIAIFVAGTLFVLLLIAIGRWVGSFKWIPAFLGVFFGGVLIFLRTRTFGLKRFNYHASLSILLGLGLTFSSMPIPGLSVYYAVFGIWLLSWGVWVLAKYLRENPLPERDNDE
ncbi:MAG: hypothetical protein U0X74_03670 [Anaerolineales bacterium]